MLAAIRAGKGRIGLADVMRVTGLPREKADPMMARLMLDYEGDVDVSEEGGIVYRFAAIREDGDGRARSASRRPRGRARSRCRRSRATRPARTSPSSALNALQPASWASGPSRTT